MTTIVYKEEMITSNANSGAPRNVQTKTFTVQIMGDGTGSGSRTSGSSSITPRHSSRGGSPKPAKKFSVRGASKMGKQSSFPPSGYNPHVFTITAYLPHDGGKRLRVSFHFCCYFGGPVCQTCCCQLAVCGCLLVMFLVCFQCC